jgi:hypothetical protein
MKSAPMTHENIRLASPYRRSLNLLAPSPLFLFLLCHVLVFSVVSGCGTGEYERRLETRRSDKAKTEAKLRALYAPLEVRGTPVSVRMPKTVFLEPPLVEGALVGGKPVDVRRVKPGKLVTIPGLKLTYEGFVDTEGVKLPYYCYVGVIDAQGGQVLEEAANKMRMELAAQRPQDTSLNWQDLRVETPDGSESDWKKLRVENSQEFFTLDKAGQGQFKSVPGVLEIYLHVEAKSGVVIAWRMPAGIESKVNLKKWATLVAECVSVKK